MDRSYRIGVDGGGTKTECILIDDSGAVVARHVAPGCNPSVVGPEQARVILTTALDVLRAHSSRRQPPPAISHTHIYAAGSRAFWRETAATLSGCGRVFTADDSYPVLELATGGDPGLVLHGGTGSFAAARAPDGSVHYAGGIGWRFGDGGSGYDLGRRAIARGLLELQGWAAASTLLTTLREHTQLGADADAAAVTRFFYTHPDPNRQIAALAPAILESAGKGEDSALEVVGASCDELLTLALRVATRLFPETEPGGLKAGLSGPILTHGAVLPLLASRSPFRFVPVEGAPIEGVRRLLARA